MRIAMMCSDQKISTIRASVSTSPTRTVDTLSDQAGYWEMDDSVDYVELLEAFRDQSSLLATKFLGNSTKNVRMRCYLMGMSDAYASAVALMVNGDPNLAMQSNTQGIREILLEKEQHGEKD
jgi:hypothetical protein